MICFFIRSFCRNWKIREEIREQKIEKTKEWKDINVDLFIDEYEEQPLTIFTKLSILGVW